MTTLRHTPPFLPLPFRLSLSLTEALSQSLQKATCAVLLSACDGLREDARDPWQSTAQQSMSVQRERDSVCVCVCVRDRVKHINSGQ